MADAPRLTFAERSHSLIGPSSFEAVEICLQRAMPGPRIKRSSFYANEGTVAHALFEACLTSNRDPGDWLGHEYTAGEGSDTITVDIDMVNGVASAVNWVRENIRPGYFVEEALDMPDSDMHGYVDVFGIDHAGLWVTADLKYGTQFVPASAPQLGFYILMGMVGKGIGLSPIPDDVVVAKAVIFQPRLEPPVRDHLWTAGALRALRARLAAVEEVLERGDATYNPGSGCRWCARAAACPALQLIARDAASFRISADPMHPVDAARLTQIAGMIPNLKVWLKAAEEATEGYLKAGGALPNAYMKQGRVSRHWRDPDAAEDLLRQYGVEPYEPPALLSPAKAEKALPKAAKAAVAEIVASVPGNPVMAFGEPPETPIVNPVALENAGLSAMALRLTGPQAS